MKQAKLPSLSLFTSQYRIFWAFLLGLLVLYPCHAFADRQVTLAWDANDPQPEGYRVFCRAAGESYAYSHPIWDSTATTCTLIGLDEYTDYAFVVRAYDGNLESADSEEVWLPGLVAPPEQPEAASPENDAEDLFLTPVLQAGAFSSPDPSDHHLQTQWVITRESDGLCMMDGISTSDLTEFDIPPLMLEEDTTYVWTVRYYGSKGSVSEWSTPSRFTTGESALDHDGNGIPDDQEVGLGIDLDDNGVADAQQDNLLCVHVLDGDAQIAVQAPAGSGVTQISAMEATDLDTVGAAAQLPYDLPLGLISFRLELEHVGGIAEITVYFSEQASPEARWVKHDSINGWQDYSAHAVFAADRLSVDLELQDGGFGDADGVANGIILDPSGIGISNGNVSSGDDSRSVSGSASSSGGGGGGGCFISAIF